MHEKKFSAEAVIPQNYWSRTTHTELLTTYGGDLCHFESISVLQNSISAFLI